MNVILKVAVGPPPNAVWTKRLLLFMLLWAAMATRTQADPVTLLSDDFESVAVGSNPGTPPLGLPWQIVKATPDSVAVIADPFAPSNKVVQLGGSWSTAVSPFSPASQSVIAANKRAVLSFDYRSISDKTFVPQLDFGLFDNNTGQPAFLVRVVPDASTGSSTLHDLYYLDPVKGLADTGLKLPSDALQNVRVSIDLGKGTYQLDAGGGSATLPLFTCPSTVQDAQFSNYVLGSGAAGRTNIDNVSVTSAVPELGTVALLTACGLFLALAKSWAVLRSRK